MAVEEALKTGHSRYAVAGCGAVGLATARLLQRRGFGVTIYAKDLPPNTTSNVAEAQFDPDVLPEDFGEFRDEYVRAARLSHRYYQDMVGEQISTSTPVDNMKWVRWTADIATVCMEMARGNMSVAEYFESLNGKKVSALFALDDPLPFIAEILMSPYLWSRRGF